MKKGQRLLSLLMFALSCSICYVFSSAFAQQKLDQAAVEKWRADLRYLAEQADSPRRSVVSVKIRGEFTVPMLCGPI
jgi:hypothetical protein